MVIFLVGPGCPHGFAVQGVHALQWGILVPGRDVVRPRCATVARMEDYTRVTHRPDIVARGVDLRKPAIRDIVRGGRIRGPLSLPGGAAVGCVIDGRITAIRLPYRPGRIGIHGEYASQIHICDLAGTLAGPRFPAVGRPQDRAVFLPGIAPGIAHRPSGINWFNLAAGVTRQEQKQEKKDTDD